MKKKYVIPTVDMMDIEAEALLEASLELKEGDATGDGMAREFFLFNDITEDEE